MKLRDVPAYSNADWERDATASGRLQCPNCDHAEWCRPCRGTNADGSERRYRACKVCGCWQEADGTPAYRCWVTFHVCLGLVADGGKCPSCEGGGPMDWHACGRVLPTNELGVTPCPNCGIILLPLHVIPWPVSAD